MTNLVLLAQADANNGAGGGAVLGGLLAFGALFWVIAIVLSIFWLWMLIDVVTSSKPADEKILWFLVVFFLHILGALIYFFVGRDRRTTTVSGAGPA